MRRFNFVRSPLFMITALALVAIVFVRCTKTSSAAAAYPNRSLATGSEDSTVFSPFYDSTLVPYANSPASANDWAVTTGVLNIVKTNCSTPNCHGGQVQPTLNSYASIKALVVPGNPAQSQLWQLLTTNDLNKAMPPVNTGNDLSITEKNIVYNWIQNGAEEQPSLIDYRPAAIHFIATGCTSANCHSMARVVGKWARNGWIACGATDTSNVTVNGTLYPEMQNQTIINTAWQAYADSVKQYYADTTANASFKPWKSMVGGTHDDGPLNDYDAILLDVIYPKGQRSNPVLRAGTGSSTISGANCNVIGNTVKWYLGGTSGFIARIDSTLAFRFPGVSGGTGQTPGAWIKFTDRTSGRVSYQNAGMTYSDGGMDQIAVPIIRAWYFLDPNIPDLWKFGPDGSGIFGHINADGTVGTPITKQ